MAAEAKKEGFDEIAKKFAGVDEVEKQHEKRYNDLLNNLKQKRSSLNLKKKLEFVLIVVILLILLYKRSWKMSGMWSSKIILPSS